MSEVGPFEQVASQAQVRFERMMAASDRNPFGAANEAIRETLGELTAVNYARLLADQPQLLDAHFVTKAIPVESFTVRRMLGDAFVFELEKRIRYDKLDLAVLEKHARREPPAHMAGNFRAAVASRLGMAGAGV
ncbi:hypothetical protein HFN89_03830 [Rhizobium laguerreae]|nr:hypothetical protein [Rhizobium laguerreae]